MACDTDEARDLLLPELIQNFQHSALGFDLSQIVRDTNGLVRP